MENGRAAQTLPRVTRPKRNTTQRALAAGAQTSRQPSKRLKRDPAQPQVPWRQPHSSAHWEWSAPTTSPSQRRAGQQEAPDRAEHQTPGPGTLPTACNSPLPASAQTSRSDPSGSAGTSKRCTSPATPLHPAELPSSVPRPPAVPAPHRQAQTQNPAEAHKTRSAHPTYNGEARQATTPPTIVTGAMVPGPALADPSTCLLLSPAVQGLTTGPSRLPPVRIQVLAAGRRARSPQPANRLAGTDPNR